MDSLYVKEFSLGIKLSTVDTNYSAVTTTYSTYPVHKSRDSFIFKLSRIYGG